MLPYQYITDALHRSEAATWPLLCACAHAAPNDMTKSIAATDGAFRQSPLFLAQ